MTMKNKVLRIFLGGFIGLVIGIFVGGYFGLVVGGTFLGGFDIYEQTGIEGYEISTYIGGVIGGIALMVWGVKRASKTHTKK